MMATEPWVSTALSQSFSARPKKDLAARDRAARAARAAQLMAAWMAASTFFVTSLPFKRRMKPRLK